MIFLYISAFFVITLIVGAVSALLGMLLMETTDSEVWIVPAWIFCVFGLGSSLTYSLYNLGII